jgi:hypothetical protein
MLALCGADKDSSGSKRDTFGPWRDNAGNVRIILGPQRATFSDTVRPNGAIGTPTSKVGGL